MPSCEATTDGVTGPAASLVPFDGNGPPQQSDFGLLGDFQSIVHFNAEIADSRFELGVTEQQLDSAEILGSAVDECRLRSPHRMRAVKGRF